MLRILLAGKRLTLRKIQDKLETGLDGTAEILDALAKVGFVRETGGAYKLHDTVDDDELSKVNFVEGSRNVLKKCTVRNGFDLR